MILSSAKNCSVTSYITIFCFCFLAHYGALHHRKSLGRFLSSCCWPWMTSQGQPKMLLPYDHKIVIWILIYDFTEMMMITRQNVHLKFEEKYTRKDFFFGQKKEFKTWYHDVKNCTKNIKWWPVKMWQIKFYN